MFVDFQELKDKVSFHDVVQLLQLPMKKAGNQLRGPCPACNKGGDRALVVTEGKGFFCFGAHTGGDQIALFAHVQKCSVKDAAQELSKAFTVQTVPEKVEGGMQPLTYLEHDHDSVRAIGFDVEVAKRIGLGYAPKGLMRGTVAVPIRDEHGKLLGYIGIEEAKLPPNFMTNIVPFGKKSA